MAIATSAGAAGWTTFAVDDSQSRTEEPVAPLRWRTPLPSNKASPLLDAVATVRIVLNVAPWVGKVSRIYMVMPPQALTSLGVEWVSGGVLQSGRLVGGQRRLVYQGVIAGPRLEDVLRVRATVDARDSSAPAPINFRFEIEVPA